MVCPIRDVLMERDKLTESEANNSISECKEALMERLGDGEMPFDILTESEANNSISECKEALMERLGDGEMPFDICEEYFGLEPDYLEELINELV